MIKNILTISSLILTLSTSLVNSAEISLSHKEAQTKGNEFITKQIVIKANKAKVWENEIFCFKPNFPSL